MNNRYAALVALVLVQLFYGLTFTFANDVIVGGRALMVFPFGIQEVNMIHWTLLPNYI